MSSAIRYHMQRQCTFSAPFLFQRFEIDDELRNHFLYTLYNKRCELSQKKYHLNKSYEVISDA